MHRLSGVRAMNPPRVGLGERLHHRSGTRKIDGDFDSSAEIWLALVTVVLGR